MVWSWRNKFVAIKAGLAANWKMTDSAEYEKLIQVLDCFEKPENKFAQLYLQTLTQV